MKKILSILLCILLLSTSCVFASERTVIEEKIPVIENGSIVNNQRIQNLVEDYFSVREQVLDVKQINKDNYMKNLASVLDTTNWQLISQEEERSYARENMAKYHDVYVIESKSIPSVKNIEPIQVEGYDQAYKVDIYEWTEINYNDGNDGPIDTMGYAIDHNMVIGMEKDGKFVVLDDKYNDTMFTGKPKDFSVDIAISEKEINVIEKNVFVPASISTSNLDVNAIIEYADKYVGHTGTEGAAAYNSSYVSFAAEVADCANYVSQCLRAGGLAFDLGANGVKNINDADDWWYDGSLGSSKYDKSAAAWRNVPSMINYFTNIEGCNYVTASKTNVYPGNPVLSYLNGSYNHVGICVGYNYNDVPIINAHTNDRYHVPYTFFNSPKTIQIFTSNHLYRKPTSAETITPSSTLKTDYTVLISDNNIYYKINHPSSKTSNYTIKLGGDSSKYTHIYVYQQKRNDSYMYEIKHLKGIDYSGTVTVNPDYNYYLRCYTDVTSGTNGFTLEYQLG